MPVEGHPITVQGVEAGEATSIPVDPTTENGEDMTNIYILLEVRSRFKDRPAETPAWLASSMGFEAPECGDRRTVLSCDDFIITIPKGGRAFLTKEELTKNPTGIWGPSPDRPRILHPGVPYYAIYALAISASTPYEHIKLCDDLGKCIQLAELPKSTW